ncbi:hypothetical protein ACLOJK_021489 [Asimina triloba]
MTPNFRTKPLSIANPWMRQREGDRGKNGYPTHFISLSAPVREIFISLELLPFSPQQPFDGASISILSDSIVLTRPSLPLSLFGRSSLTFSPSLLLPLDLSISLPLSLFPSPSRSLSLSTRPSLSSCPAPLSLSISLPLSLFSSPSRSLFLTLSPSHPAPLSLSLSISMSLFPSPSHSFFLALSPSLDKDLE